MSALPHVKTAPVVASALSPARVRLGVAAGGLSVVLLLAACGKSEAPPAAAGGASDLPQDANSNTPDRPTAATPKRTHAGEKAETTTGRVLQWGKRDKVLSGEKGAENPQREPD